MPINPSRATAAADQAYEEALGRMLAAREHVRRRYWSPEAMANVDPDAPEVVGIPDPEIMRDDL